MTLADLKNSCGNNTRSSISLLNFPSFLLFVRRFNLCAHTRGKKKTAFTVNIVEASVAVAIITLKIQPVFLFLPRLLRSHHHRCRSVFFFFFLRPSRHQQCGLLVCLRVCGIFFHTTLPIPFFSLQSDLTVLCFSSLLES